MYSNLMYNYLLNYTDKIERYSIDECFLDYTDVEKEGIITPLTSLECKYKKAAFYEDQLQIHASLTKLSPVRLEFSYKVTRGGDLIATGKTTHGMVTKDLKPINVKKEHPEIYRMFENALD